MSCVGCVGDLGSGRYVSVHIGTSNVACRASSSSSTTLLRRLEDSGRRPPPRLCCSEEIDSFNAPL